MNITESIDALDLKRVMALLGNYKKYFEFDGNDSVFLKNGISGTKGKMRKIFSNSHWTVVFYNRANYYHKKIGGNPFCSFEFNLKTHDCIPSKIITAIGNICSNLHSTTPHIRVEDGDRDILKTRYIFQIRIENEEEHLLKIVAVAKRVVTYMLSLEGVREGRRKRV